MHTSLSATLVVFLHLCSQLAASSPLASHSSDRGGIFARNSEPTSNTPASASSSSSHIKLKRNQAAQHARRTDPLVLEAWAERQASRLKRRYARPAAAAAADAAATQHCKRQRGYAELHNMYADTEYFAELSIGTPSKPFNVILDTGSADLWLAGAGCTEATGCAAGTRLYSGTESFTVEPHSNATLLPGDDPVSALFNVSYGSGEASGSLMKDSVSLAGFTVPNQTFASCHSITPGLLSGDVSGILGLGFQSIAASEAMPWWQNLAEQGQIGEMGFAFTRYLHTPEAATSVMPGGIATFGAANSSLYTGDISWNSLTDTGYWMIAMQSMSVNGTMIPGISSNNVAIDTGTSLIGAPAEAVTQLFAQIPGSSPSTSDAYRGYYYFPCNSQVEIAFTFGGRSWAVSPADFNLGRVDANGNCLGAVFSLDTDASVQRPGGPALPEYIIGDTFLKNMYTVFRYDNPRAVGFAELSQTARDLDDEVPPDTGPGVTNSIAQSSSPTSSCPRLRSTSMVYTSLVLVAAIGSIFLS